jgi:hypothetical protein
LKSNGNFVLATSKHAIYPYFAKCDLKIYDRRGVQLSCTRELAAQDFKVNAIGNIAAQYVALQLSFFFRRFSDRAISDMILHVFI